MVRRFSIYLITLFTMSLLTDCHCSKKVAAQAPVPVEQKIIQSMVTAPALVYKTKKDYSSYVPVIMNAEKTQIVSYPHPTDILYRGKLSFPTPLNNGYLLDNRGIGANVVFSKYTYEAYSQLKEAPTMEQLMNNLQDKNPLLELWNCGSRTGFKDEVKELNLLIEKGFPHCNQLVKELKVFLYP